MCLTEKCVFSLLPGTVAALRKASADNGLAEIPAFHRRRLEI
jgi:hypothetical protein